MGSESHRYSFCEEGQHSYSTYQEPNYMYLYSDQIVIIPFEDYHARNWIRAICNILLDPFDQYMWLDISTPAQQVSTVQSAGSFGIILGPRTENHKVMTGPRQPQARIIWKVQQNSMKVRLANHSCCTFHYIFVYCRPLGSALMVSAFHFPLDSIPTIFISFARAARTDSPSRSRPRSQLLIAACSLEADVRRVISHSTQGNGERSRFACRS
jgi:hypothetical protein